MKKEILERARFWTSDIFDKKTRSEVRNLLEKNDEGLLTDMFYKDLEFGTGGMRGIMGPGTNRMNIYTVGKASQGLANYLLDTHEDAKSRGVAIAYDSRNNSELFARESAAVFAANGLRVFIFRALRPTPLLSYTVMKLRTVAGVVITASHNPKEYNGYKVYGSEGFQVTPPEDTRIVSYVEKVELVRDVKRIDFEEGKEKGLINEIDESVENTYLERVHKFAQKLLKGLPARESGKTLKVVYTPLHGTGITLVPKALEEIEGVTLILEPAQSIPDGNFPTTPTPNPEEPEALSRAISLATEENADMVIATDPDCDRMALAVPDEKGTFIPLNGNQIGTLFTTMIATSIKQAKTLPPKATIVTTIVSTELVEKIAAHFGIEVEYTLTGFKYIGEKMFRFEREGDRNFIFGFEESYGFLADTFVRDKDGVIGAIMGVLLVRYAVSHYGSVLKLLEEIYRTYGVYLEYLKSFTLKGAEGTEKIKQIMERLRINPPQRLLGKEIHLIKDYLTQKVIDLQKKKERKIEGFPKSNVLQFYTNDVKVSMRPSGTEPKIKFYFAINSEFHNSLKETKAIIDERFSAISEEIFNLCGLR